MLETLLTPGTGAALSGRVRWMDVIEGVRVCDFNCALSSPPEVPGLAETHFETLFCRDGGLRLEWKNGRQLRVQEGEILLVSDPSHIHRLLIPDSRLAGELVTIDTAAARQSLDRLCALLGGLQLDTRQVGELMRAHDGCAVIRDTAWSDAVFAALPPLPTMDRARYSVLKSTELLYLLCSNSSLLSAPSTMPHRDRYQPETARQVQEYMLSHLSEPLTIAQLAARFHISPTALKDCFRQLYGRPLHQYLLECRVQKAAELLRDSCLSVMEIAEAVGYTSASQFGVAFKRRFHLTPSQFRRRAREEKIQKRVQPAPLCAEPEGVNVRIVEPEAVPL